MSAATGAPVATSSSVDTKASASVTKRKYVVLGHRRAGKSTMHAILDPGVDEDYYGVSGLGSQIHKKTEKEGKNELTLFYVCEPGFLMGLGEYHVRKLMVQLRGTGATLIVTGHRYGQIPDIQPVVVKQWFKMMYGDNVVHIDDLRDAQAVLNAVKSCPKTTERLADDLVISLYFDEIRNPG